MSKLNWFQLALFLAGVGFVLAHNYSKPDGVVRCQRVGNGHCICSDGTQH